MASSWILSDIARDEVGPCLDSSSSGRPRSPEAAQPLLSFPNCPGSAGSEGIASPHLSLYLISPERCLPCPLHETHPFTWSNLGPWTDAFSGGERGGESLLTPSSSPCKPLSSPPTVGQGVGVPGLAHEGYACVVLGGRPGSALQHVCAVGAARSTRWVCSCLLALSCDSLV